MLLSIVSDPEDWHHKSLPVASLRDAYPEQSEGLGSVNLEAQGGLVVKDRGGRVKEPLELFKNTVSLRRILSLAGFRVFVTKKDEEGL